jgi:hypothetical protein
MNDLDNALIYTEAFLDIDMPRENHAALIKVMEAARTVADLHKKIDLDQLGDGLRFAHITDSDGDYLMYVAQQVAVALTS